MRLLGLDAETTGLDTEKDLITEIGAVLWDTETNTPLRILSEMSYDDSYPELPDIIKELTGLTTEMIKEHGKSPKVVLSLLEELISTGKADYIVAHNGNSFDKPIIMSNFKRYGVPLESFKKVPWLDTTKDIPYKKQPESKKLKHLALDAGFINPFPHRAVSDVLTMLKVLSTHNLQEVIEYSKSPDLVVKADVSYENRELAKKRYYSWQNLGDKSYYKSWVKLIKEVDFEKEKQDCDFNISIVDGKKAEKELETKGQVFSDPVLDSI